jgi:hypothetical protein
MELPPFFYAPDVPYPGYGGGREEPTPIKTGEASEKSRFKLQIALSAPGMGQQQACPLADPVENVGIIFKALKDPPDCADLLQASVV